MAGRLSFSLKDVNLINDLKKEVIKDISGQKVYYYPISYEKSNIDEIYEETDKKIPDQPIILNAEVVFNPEEVRSNEFGTDRKFTIKWYIPYQDLLDRKVHIKEGDFFTYGNYPFEVTHIRHLSTIFGQIEHYADLEVNGTQSRNQNFITKVFGPRAPLVPGGDDDGEREDRFYQQRGMDKDAAGQDTGDIRETQEKGLLEKPLSGARELGEGSEFDGPKDDRKQEEDSVYDEW